jgi:hypothetical protein
MAGVASARGDSERAARLLGSAEALVAEIGGVLAPAFVEIRKRVEAAIRSKLKGPVLEEAWAEGRAWSIDFAVERALQT